MLSFLPGGDSSLVSSGFSLKILCPSLKLLFLLYITIVRDTRDTRDIINMGNRYNILGGINIWGI
jgi:hypothetical protein